MTKIYLSIVAAIVALSLQAQSPFENFFQAIENADWDRKQEMVDSFMLARKSSSGIPFSIGDTAYFFYHGNPSSVLIAGDFNGWQNSEDYLTHIGSSELFYFRKFFESTARIEYKYVVDGSNWILDPENENTGTGGYGDNSAFTMPNYIEPWEMEVRAEVSKGSIEEISIECDIIGKTYTVFVYKPFGYDTSSTNFPCVYFQDGPDYINYGKADIVFDNLIHDKLIYPTIGVFVKTDDRPDDYVVQADAYANSFANEIVPYIDNHFKTISYRGARVVTGDSDGAGIAGEIADSYPEVFGICNLQSIVHGANDHFLEEPEDDTVLIYYQYGKYDSPWWVPNQISYASYLVASAYPTKVEEYYDGHNFTFWGSILDSMLINTFPPDYEGTPVITDVNYLSLENIADLNINLKDGLLTIGFTGSEYKIQTLDIVSSNGLLVHRLHAETELMQINTNSFNSGIYVLNAQLSNGMSFTEKFVIH
jgi:enterochelin esterase-like enzyme